MKRVLAVAFTCLGALTLTAQTEKRPAEVTKEKAPAGATSSAGEPEKGRQIFKGRCAICHFATSTAERVGPGMKDFFKQEKMSRSSLPLTEENVRKVILEGSATMQPFRSVLNKEQLDDLIAYLKTL